MKLILAMVIGILCAVTLQAWGAEIPATSLVSADSLSNIHSGNWNVGGSIDFAKNSGRRNDSSEFNTVFTAKYFLVDRFALGLAGGVDVETGEDTVATVGPAVSYVFWTNEKLAASIGSSIRVGLTDATVSSVVGFDLGFNYFITPSVALGPSLFYNHYNSRSRDYSRYGMSMGLGIYL